MRREDPGPEFTARVLAAAARTDAGESRWQALLSRWRPMRIRWAAAGALACLLVTAGAVEYREHRERTEGLAAKQRLVFALRIAGTKLNLARDKVQELNAAERGQ
jgi:hypothetical protein